MRRTYNEILVELLEAIEISFQAIEHCKLATEVERKQLRNYFLQVNDLLQNQEPKDKSASSLKHIEIILFCPWNEGVGYIVERFWELIEQSNLKFIRKRDIVEDVLRKGKITKDIERDSIGRHFLELQQMKKITKNEAIQIGEMIKKYDNNLEKNMLHLSKIYANQTIYIFCQAHSYRRRLISEAFKC